MNRIQYLRQHCKAISQVEANEIIANGSGIVVGGGYVHYSENGCHYYHAYGTFPGCMRGGPSGNVNEKINEWYSVSPLDIVCLDGYVPHDYYSPPESFSKMDGCPDWNELNDVLLSSSLSDSDRSDPDKNAAFWRQYFNRE
jgi:hypothetical protein